MNIWNIDYDIEDVKEVEIEEEVEIEGIRVKIGVPEGLSKEEAGWDEEDDFDEILKKEHLTNYND